MLVCPKPLDWESPKSILYRATWGNGYSSLPSMIGLVVEVQSRLDVMCGRGRGVRSLLTSFHSEFGVNLSSSFFQQESRITSEQPLSLKGFQVPYSLIAVTSLRFCSECFKQHGHSKFFSDITAFSACPVHKRAFSSRCQSCDAEYDWFRFKQDGCVQCGFCLAGTTSPIKERPAELELEKLIRKSANTKVNQILSVLAHLKLYHSDDLFENGALLELAMDFCQGRFNRLRANLLKVYGGHQFLPLRFLLSAFLASPDPIVREIANTELARKGKDTQSPLLVASEVQDWMNLEQAQSALGVTSRTLKILVDQKFLCREISGQGKAIISLDSMFAFIQWISEKIQAKGIVAFEPLKGVANKKYVVNLGSVRETDLQILDINWNNGLSSLQFGMPISANPKTRSWLSVKEFAEKADCYTDVIYRACDSGFIEPDLPASKEGKYRFSPGFVDSFNRTYITLAKLNKRVGSRPTTLSVILRAKNIFPVSGPDVDGGLSPIYKASDLKGAKFAIWLNDPYFKSRAGRKPAGEETFDSKKWMTAKQVKVLIGVGDQALSILVRDGHLITGMPSGRIDNFRFYERQVAENFASRIQYAITPQNLWEEIGIPKREFYLRFVESGQISLIKMGKRKLLVTKADADFVRRQCEEYVSLSTADKITGAPPKHFRNLANTGRLSVKGYLPASLVKMDLIERGVAHLLISQTTT